MEITYTAFEALAVTTTSLGFTAGTYGNADYAVIHHNGTPNVRFRVDGGAPTGTSGLLLEWGDELRLENRDEVVNTRFITASGTATLMANFGKRIT